MAHYKTPFIVYKEPRFTDTETLTDRITEYFNEMQSYDRPPTITGMALFLGFCDRQSIYDYKNNNKYSCIIKAAISFIENYAETKLLDGTANNGTTYWLNNHGWKQKQDVELSGGLANTVINIGGEEV